MITRITSHTSMRSAQRNLQTNLEQLNTLQEQAMSHKAINRPSDDPAATADSLKVRADQRAVEQYSRNADNGNGWLTTIDTALSTTNSLLRRVRDLTVQGANDGALSQTAKDALAKELDGLGEELLAQANSSYLGRSVFAGTTGAGAAFNVDHTHNGVAGATVERRIGPSSTVRVDIDGVAVFGSADPVAGTDDSVFALVAKIADELRGTNPGGPVNVGSNLTALDERMKTIAGQQAQVGARQNQIERAEGLLAEQKGSLEAQRASAEDVDLAQVILDLKTQEVTYQSALAVTARVLQPTLMDFLR
jgi:flagellar hook-associated protein 3 FlgL